MWRGNTSFRPQRSVVRIVLRLWETIFFTTEKVQVLFCMLFPVFLQMLGVPEGHQGSPTSSLGNGNIKFKLNIGYQWNETDSEKIQ